MSEPTPIFCFTSDIRKKLVEYMSGTQYCRACISFFTQPIAENHASEPIISFSDVVNIFVNFVYKGCDLIVLTNQKTKEKSIHVIHDGKVLCQHPMHEFTDRLVNDPLLKASGNDSIFS